MILLFFYTAFVDSCISKFICDTFHKLEETKEKWFTSLQKMPNGVLIYDIKQNKITYQNHVLEDIVGGIDGESYLDSELKFKT